MKLALGGEITAAQLEDAARRSLFDGEHVGICTTCGEERGNVEPDAVGYECFDCGEHTVAGAEYLLVRYSE